MSVAKIETVVNNGVVGQITKEFNYYNLDAITSVGYRVKSQSAQRKF